MRGAGSSPIRTIIATSNTPIKTRRRRGVRSSLAIGFVIANDLCINFGINGGRGKMRRFALISAAVGLLALSAPAAFAQVGSALGNNAMMHQGPMSDMAGIGDLQK